MTEETKKELYDVKAVREGLLNAILCAKKELSPEAAAYIHSTRFPTGTSSGQWVYREKSKIDFSIWDDPNFPESMGVYPTPCGDHPDTHQHFSVDC